jgi:hypothetical protein
MPLDDHRARGVADRGEHHGACSEELAALPAQVDPDQRDHPGEADEHAEQAGAGRPLGVVEAECEQGDQQRDGRDQNGRDRGVDVLLARRDQRKRTDHLGRRVGEDPEARTLREHLEALPRDEGEEQRRPEYEPSPGQEEGRDPVVDRDLDE